MKVPTMVRKRVTREMTWVVWFFDLKAVPR
jgi:hypothetical protein